MVRSKQRYVVARVDWGSQGRLVDPSLGASHFVSALKELLAVHFGDLGVAVSLQSLAVKYWNSLTGVLLVRIERASHRLLLIALACTQTLKIKGEQRSCRMLVLHVGGTIRSCKQKLIEKRTKGLSDDQGIDSLLEALDSMEGI
jgi:RNase P/RNase MRP subunit POP5